MATARKLRVFLVEDHHLMRHGLAALLQQHGDMEVAGQAANGVEALAQLEAARPDVVLVDLTMPVMNGVELTRRIKERLPRLPVLILSMYGDPVGVTRALRAGASGYIVKESMVEELTFAVRAVAEGGLFLSPLVTGPVVRDYLAGLARFDDDFGLLTARESEVLQLLAEGRTAAEIADTLTISLPTVRSHQANIKRKLGLNTRAELLRYALDHHIVASSTHPFKPWEDV